MRLLWLWLGLCAVAQAHADARSSALVFVGTHGAQGIYAARLDETTGRLSPLGLAVELQRATWLVGNPTQPVIYSVAAPDGGMPTESNIYSLAVNPQSGQLNVVGKTGAGGRDATHMVVDPVSSTLLIASYGSGDVSALPIQPDGSLGPVASVQKDYGSGPTPRQTSSHAHGVALDPTHRYVLAADLGADRIFVYHFDAATRMLTPAPAPFEALPPGSGPRHLVFSSNGKFLFVDAELTAELRSYRWDAAEARLQLLQTVSTADRSVDKSAAEIALSPDGRFLYLSLRGDQDSIVVYAIDGVQGTLQEIQRVPSQGKTPWSFGIDPTGHWLLVTNEGSNSVTEFKVDPVGGKLTPTGQSLQIPQPVAVVFYRR